jgi:hypothetical protein
MNERQLTAKQRYWLEHVERCAESGQSMRAYAEAHDLNVQSFYSGKAQLAKRSRNALKASASFTEVQVRSATVPAVIQIRFPNGCVLESRGLDDASLRSLCSALLHAQ